MYRKFTLLLIAAIMTAFSFPFPAVALEGKAGEVIQTMEEIKDLRQKGLLNEGYFRDFSELIENGHSIKIVPTTDRTKMVSPTYWEATQKNAASCKLGPSGELIGYISGRPFPDVKPDDPQFALKVAWNFFFRHMSDGYTQEWEYYLTDANKNVKKLWGTVGHILTNYRTDVEPKPVLDPSAADVYKKTLIIFEGPFESKGLSQLSWYHTDTTKDNAVWTWVPGLRRTTRTGAGSGCDALGGFVSVMDDDWGFAGKVIDFNWKYIKPVTMLVPSILPPPPYEAEIPKGLKAPIVDLELRTTWLIENVSKDPNYCYSKRDLYFDPETSLILSSEIYDRAGVFWKHYWQTWTAIANPPKVGGYSLMSRAGGTTDYIIGEGGPVKNTKYHGDLNNSEMNPARNYTLDYMRKIGR